MKKVLDMSKEYITFVMIYQYFKNNAELFSFRNSCKRSDKILTLVQPEVSNYTDGTDAHWEVSTLTLKQPKSSHTLVLVPRTYASKCKLT